MKFRALRPEDRAWITACRDTRVHPFTSLSFPSLFAWTAEYGLTAAGDSDFFVIRSEHDGAYYCPCGDEGKCRAFLDSLTGGAKLVYLTKQQADELAGRGWLVRHRADLSEYILSTAAEALREGHVSKSFRDKCRHFKKQFSYSVRPVGAAEMPILRRSLLALWDDPKERNFGDYSVLHREIEHFDRLGLRGLLMETAEGEHAFVLGYENTADCFTVTIGKHSPGLPTETSMVIVHELARTLDGEYPYLNLEEDLGLEGLRRAKELYSPVDRLEVYEASKP